MLAAGWSASLAVLGGFDLRIGSLTFTSNEPFRPLLAALTCFVIYVLSGGSADLPAWLEAARRLTNRVHPFAPSSRGLAWMLAAGLTFVAWFYGTKAVGAADTYGYLSQSDLWAEWSIDALKVREPIVAEVPWPNAGWAFSPVGSYRPMNAFQSVEGEDRWSMVPVYPPGLPILMAVAGVIGGFQAKFVVFPLLGGVLILATYGIGVRLASPTVGLVGAWLMATSPALLFMIMSPMSDASVSGLWAAAFYLALGTGLYSALGAGAMMSLTFLTRPNLAPLAGLLALVYFFRLPDPVTRRAALRDVFAYSFVVVAGAIFLALINQSNYGSPLASGYGPLDALFAFSHIPRNARLYLPWLVETHTPIALVGLVAALVPLRRLWPADGNRGGLVAMALSVAVVWSTYLLYQPWDAWWYLRFLLPSFPFLMLGVGAVFAKALHARGRLLQLMAAVVIVALGLAQLRTAEDRGTFEMWKDERRYVATAKMVNRETERNSLIFTGIHVGNVRYYGSRMTVYHESFPPEWLDRSIRWLSRRGVHPYLLLEEWELQTFFERFESQRALEIFAGPPVAIFGDPGRIYLYDLLKTRPRSAAPSRWDGVDASIWAAPKAPAPRLILER